MLILEGVNDMMLINIAQNILGLLAMNHIEVINLGNSNIYKLNKNS